MGRPQASVQVKQQYVASFMLELHCDQHPWVQLYTGRTFVSCLNRARRQGWKIHLQTKTATCPQCVRMSKLSVKRKRVRS